MGKNKYRYRELPSTMDTNFKNSLRRNGNAYYFWFYRMAEIYMNRLTFKNLPKTIDVPTMMWGLLDNGNVCYFNDIIMGNLCLAGVPSKSVDVYGYQKGYYIHTASGYNNHLSVSRFSPNRTGVVIYSNYLRNADIIILMEYAERLYDALRSWDVNMHNQKTSKIIGMPESQRLTMENTMKEYDGNIPIILTDSKLKFGTDEEYPVYDMTTPFVADKIWVAITNVWNDFLTWCGIENATNQKRERMVTDEVNANYGDVEQERRRSLQMIQMGFEEVNDIFGTNIEVEFNSDLASQLNAAFKDVPEIVGQLRSQKEEWGWQDTQSDLTN